MNMQSVLVVQALRHRRVIRGEIAKSEKLYGLNEEEVVLIEHFLAVWKEDAVLGVALHFGEMKTAHVQMLIDCGWIRKEQLQDAFESFLTCWSHFEKEVKNWNHWLLVRKRIQRLSLTRDNEEGWYLFPRLQELLLRHEGEYQPGIFHTGPFTSIAF